MEKRNNTEEFLRNHYNSGVYIHFRKFLGCYMIQGLNWSEVAEMIKNLIETESSEYKSGFIEELQQLKLKDDWDYIGKFVRKYAGRKLKEDKLKLMFQWLIEGLTENLAKDKK
jgi:hypothetical protein